MTTGETVPVHQKKQSSLENPHPFPWYGWTEQTPLQDFLAHCSKAEDFSLRIGSARSPPQLEAGREKDDPVKKHRSNISSRAASALFEQRLDLLPDKKMSAKIENNLKQAFTFESSANILHGKGKITAKMNHLKKSHNAELPWIWEEEDHEASQTSCKAMPTMPLLSPKIPFSSPCQPQNTPFWSAYDRCKTSISLTFSHHVKTHGQRKTIFAATRIKIKTQLAKVASDKTTDEAGSQI